MREKDFSLRTFFARESSSGILLVVGALTGLILANSPLKNSYFEFLAQGFSWNFGLISITLTVQKFINYVLMTLFFFVVGLEIKRELVSGHLASVKRALAPFLAAAGGMLIPALIYLAISGREAPNGWAVPVATDIALAVGLISMMGSRASLALKTFLLAIAIIDDIGAILIIALVYSDGIDLPWITGAIAMILLSIFLKKIRVTSLIPFILIGVALWYCLYQAGVHPTLAGVVMGLLAPASKRSEVSNQSSMTWIEWLEEKVHPWSSFLIIPLFALANAGVSLSRENLLLAFHSPIAWGIFFGLVLGKPIGIIVFALLGSKMKIAELPEGTKFVPLLATASSAGIGFTVAIFLAKLAFNQPALQEIAITSVVGGSLVSGLLSFALFRTRQN